MDKSRTQLRGRHLPAYTKGVKDFIEYAHNYEDKGNGIKCPSNKCNNRYFKPINMVKAHLEENGIDKTYTRWVFHGEDFEEMSEDEDDDGDVGVEQRCDGLQEMLADVCAGRYEMDINVENIPPGEASSSHGASAADEDPQPSDGMSNDLDPQLFDAMLNDLHLPLYPGCKKFSKLEFLVKLMHVKIINRWSNKSFDMNLELIKEALSTGEMLPKSYYEAKKYMRDLGLG